MRDKVLAVFQTYSEGGSCRRAREQHEITSAAFYKTLADNPDLDTQYRTIQAARADMSVDRMLELANDCVKSPEQLIESIAEWRGEGLTEDQITVLMRPVDPRHVRVAMDGLRATAEMYDRKRYGQRVAIDTEIKVSLTEAIEQGKQRALRPPCDPALITDAEYTVIPSTCDARASDKQSEESALPAPPAPIDPFEP